MTLAALQRGSFFMLSFLSVSCMQSRGKQNVMLLANLGTVQRSRGKVHEAIDSYTKALGYSPLNVSVLMSRATAPRHP